MTWVALAYGAVAYWHFRAMLRHLEPRHDAFTILLNATLALTVGPLLVIGAVVTDRLYRDH